MQTDKYTQRREFVQTYKLGQWSMTELCERYGITRPTGYLWVRRYDELGEEGLDDRPRRPFRSPNQTPFEVEQRIVALRREYGWGAKKLRNVYRSRYRGEPVPARSTVNAILERWGMLRKRRRARRWKHPDVAPLQTERPNQVWPADFKGQFKTRDGIYCYPLTVTDHYSRKLLLCKALPSIKTEGAMPAFRALFREVGLPEAIRTDNGVPFASIGIHGICQMSAWWMRLGIVHQRIRPSSPQQNGQHERMHWDLKLYTAMPPANTMRGQQRRFNAFKKTYNEVRPHEGIDDMRPDDLWVPSPRPYPDRIAPPEYPSHFEVRRVSNAGCFRLNCEQRFLSNVLANEYIGLELVGDGLYNIIYYQTLLGRVDERTGLITGC